MRRTLTAVSFAIALLGASVMVAAQPAVPEPQTKPAGDAASAAPLNDA